MELIKVVVLLIKFKLLALGLEERQALGLGEKVIDDSKGERIQNDCNVLDLFRDFFVLNRDEVNLELLMKKSSHGC